MTEPELSYPTAVYYHASRIFRSPCSGVEFTPVKGNADYQGSSLIIPIAMVHPESSVRQSEELLSNKSFAFC